jgi:hypothetical protein
MITHITAVTFTLMIFVLMAAAYFGWGQAASIALGIGKQKPDSVVMPIWLGWALTLLVFQLLRFFLPITAYVVIPVFVLGLVFSIPQIWNTVRRFPLQRSVSRLTVISAIVALGVVVWIVSRAMVAPENFDSGLYHLNAIRWISTYPIVLGLGNLHGRLAFNQSFFTYVAALNFHPFFGYGRSLGQQLSVTAALGKLIALLAFVNWTTVSSYKRASIRLRFWPLRPSNSWIPCAVLKWALITVARFDLLSPATSHVRNACPGHSRMD